jgi:valyl-tRNA synthetase
MSEAAIDKAYEPAQVEPGWVGRWLAAGAFAPRRQAGDDRPPYVVLLPPPNVTGVLHMGHVLANTLQDVFVRWARMSGRETLWWPGTDHAGIATQKVVEKNLRQEGIDPAALGREAFVARCWQWKEKSHTHIVQQMQRMGWSLDWSREYFTLDEHMSRAVVEVFIRLYRKGLVYKGAYITNWCPSCRTAISDEEVEHIEQQGKIWTLRYPFADGEGFVRVATTRPETILGDVAVAIHPDDPRAKNLVGRILRLPVLGRLIPIIADTYVDPAFGTGMVKITPAHDPNDFHVGKRHDLQAPIVIDPDGKMSAAAGPYAGQDRFQARLGILKQLETEGLLDKAEAYTLNIGRHDRCETIIEPYLSQQWFVKMQPLAVPALAAVEAGRITFYPERWRNVYLHWMRNIQDWCISRQLWWGHRIPIWYCDACNHEHVSHAAPAACTGCGGGALRQDESVLDTWFSSWLCPFSPMGWPEKTPDLARYHPMTLLVTGYEIIFFWVARMIMASLEFMGDVPFTQVLLNGIVRDAKGRKLSKSLGNSPDPLDLIATHGADAVRFSTVMLSPPGQDTFFEAKNVETGQHFANKIWNAARLVLTNAEQRGYVGELELDAGRSAAAVAIATRRERDAAAALTQLASEAVGDEFQAALATLWEDTFARPLPADIAAGLRLEDRWILHRYTDAVAAVERDLESLRANDAATDVYHFFWDEYCAWYLESIKPRMQGDDRATARSAHAVALVLLASASKLLAPLMPFLAEELWSRIPGTTGLVATSRYPRELPGLRDARSLERFALVVGTASAIRTVRSERNVPPGKKAPALVQKDTAAAVGWTAEQGALLQLHAKLAGLEPTSDRAPDAVSVLVGGLQLYLPLGGLVDLGAERERLQRELDKAERDLGALDAKLANSGFVAKAPAALVEGERARRSDLAGRRDRLRDEIAALTGKAS